MSTKLEKLPNSRIKLTIEVPKDKIEPYLEGAYTRVSNQVNIAGFRPGAAPKSLILERVGTSRILSEALDLAIPELYFQAIKEHNLVPLEQPAVSIQKYPNLLIGDTSTLEFKAEVDVFPKVEIGDYKKLKVKSEKLKVEEVKEEEIESVINHLKRQQATFKDVDRATKEGDRVEIEFEGYVDNVKKDQYSSKTYPLILGSKILVPGFEENLIGMKKDQEKEFELKVKDEKVHFKTKLLDVKEVILPQLNDQFAQKFNLKDTTMLREKVKESIGKDKENRQRQEIENSILEQLLLTLKSEMPESLVRHELLRMKEEINQKLSVSGGNFEQYLVSLKKTEEELLKEWRPNAEKRVKVGLLVGEIIKQEKINPKDENAGKLAMDKLIGYATKG